MQVFGFAGYSGSGKTTLIEQLIPRFVAMGKAVSVVKHAHHSFDIDTPGKDSWRHREAGAAEVLMVSAQRWVLMHELRGAAEPDLSASLAALGPCDLVLVEGYKRAAIPKLEIHRPATGKPALWPHDDRIVAVASDALASTLDHGDRVLDLPVLDLDDTAGIAQFILHYLTSQHAATTTPP